MPVLIRVNQKLSLLRQSIDEEAGQ